MLEKIVSGGQTGVDQASLDAAIELNLPTGGFCPKGKIDENGVMPERFHFLKETQTSKWPERTELNIIHSDGTLIIATKELIGGTKLTAELARAHSKPFLIITPENTDPETIRDWIHTHAIRTLNVAGPRESQEPGIYEASKKLLTSLFEILRPTPRARL